MGIFTGLIVEVGRVRQIRRRADGVFIVIEARKVLEGTRVGDSISINGVDLTVIEMSDDSFSADASLETLRRSTLGQLQIGSRVNLEPAPAVGGRLGGDNGQGEREGEGAPLDGSLAGGDGLGGHMVQGHVDGAGALVKVVPEGNAYRMRFEVPSELSRYIAMKGSITVDGISLTVAGLGDDWFEVAIIPHTWRETILSDLRQVWGMIATSN